MKIDKNELAKKIREAENLSNEEKSNLLQLLNEKKTYGLVWENSSEDAWDVMKDSIPVLKEEPSKQIYHGSDNPNHILIEGDNLNALTALCYTHKGSIDVIYIDPPYNTGKRDFVYNDSFIGEDDDYRHSKWLSFMGKRLKIAKNLLSAKGVIFISIDDNEQASLKLLCDEVFGSNNFAANIIWEKADSPRMDAKDFSSRHDFILVYCKDKSLEPINKLKMGEAPEHYNKVDEYGKRYYLKPLRYMGNADAREDRPNLFFPLTAPDGSIVYPIRADGTDGRWRWSQEKVKKEANRIEWVRSKKGWSAYSRIYANDEAEIPVETIWYNKDVESNRNAIATLKKIFGDEKLFTNPKPVKLIERILMVAGNNQSSVLDFFAGSGTTLHATMQLNAEDGGHRQCILVTNNENGICENVTYERNKRVIEGYTTRGEEVTGLKNNNLRYYKVDFTPREKTEQNMLHLAIKSIPLLCIKNDIYQEIPQLGNVKNPRKGYRYFKEGDKQMLVILDTDMIGDIVDELGRINIEKSIPTYVYSSGHYPFTGDFDSVSEKVDLYPIPYSIYGACEKHMPPADDKELEQPEDVVLTEEEENLSINDYKTNKE